MYYVRESQKKGLFYSENKILFEKFFFLNKVLISEKNLVFVFVAVMEILLFGISRVKYRSYFIGHLIYYRKIYIVSIYLNNLQ